jgi:predicted nucleic acid-binding protein
VGIVCNAGPLISLARIGRLDLLPALFGEVIVPPAVHQEVTSDDSLPGARGLAQADWLKIAELHNRTDVERLLSSLDAGEAEVLILARQLDIPAAMDEKRGRRLASELGVLQTGTVGILLAAKQAGLVPFIRPLLDQLMAKGIRLSSRLYEEACQMAGEPYTIAP